MTCLGTFTESHSISLPSYHVKQSWHFCIFKHAHLTQLLVWDMTSLFSACKPIFYYHIICIYDEWSFVSALRGRSRSYLRLGFTFRSLSYWPQGSDCKGLFLERAHVAPYPISHEASSTASRPHVYTPTRVIPHIIHNHNEVLRLLPHTVTSEYKYLFA